MKGLNSELNLSLRLILTGCLILLAFVPSILNDSIGFFIIGYLYLQITCTFDSYVGIVLQYGIV